MPTVQVEGLGNVSFPDGTPEADMTKAVQEALTQKNAPAPLSGPIGDAPIPKAMQDTPESNNRAALQSGLVGAVKSIPQTVADVGGLVNKIPRFGESIAPKAEVNSFDQMAQAANPQEQAGKVAGAGLQFLVPLGRAFEALPSAGRAGQALNEVGQLAKDVPVGLTRTAAPLQRVTELGARGNTIPKVADQLLNRSQAISPMKFPEARDFYSSMARPSLWEKMTTSPPARAAMSELKTGFGGDIREAADTVGQGDKLTQAMNEYRRAKTLQKVAMGAGGAAAGYGAKVAGAGAAVQALKKIGVGQ